MASGSLSISTTENSLSTSAEAGCVQTILILMTTSSNVYPSHIEGYCCTDDYCCEGCRIYFNYEVEIDQKMIEKVPYVVFVYQI